MREFRIAHPRSEASGLLGIQNRHVLAAFEWDVGFWTISDERGAREAVAALGRRRRSGGWSVVRLDTRARGAARRKRTEDAETIARAGSWVYVIGSQFGTKDGRLQPRRHFVARFNEALVATDGDALRARLDVARRPFLLHRLVNDAVRDARIEIRGDRRAHARFVGPALERGRARGRGWVRNVRPEDFPVNVEGAAFLPGGHLLLGLRYPVTEDGHPILIELEGIDRYFASGGRSPDVVAARVIANVGSERAPAGVRELDCLGGEIHVLAGDLDSKPEKSALLARDPRAAKAPCEHWTVPLAIGQDASVELRATRVRLLDGDASAEGLAIVGDEVWYAHDDDQIRLSVAPSTGETPERERGDVEALSH